VPLSLLLQHCPPTQITLASVADAAGSSETSMTKASAIPDAFLPNLLIVCSS
jgi:hypothetical protein